MTSRRFTRAQVEQLLQPINPRRVLRDGKSNSHVSQQDVTAHLIRLFGFGGFDTEILCQELVFESPRIHEQTGKPTGRWDVCYKATLRLTVKDPDGNEVCHFEDGSTATAENQKRGDAHDLALKSAISLAKKRCAKDLGDQFGLSLYNKGQLTALVMRTFVMPEGDAGEGDVQEGVEQQVSMGNDEIDRPLSTDDTPNVNVLGEIATELLGRVEDAATGEELQALWRATGAALKAGQINKAEADQIGNRIIKLNEDLAGGEAA